MYAGAILSLIEGMKSNARLLLPVALASSLAACAPATADAGAAQAQSPDPVAADWPLFRGDPGLTGIAAPGLSADPELLWTFTAEGAITSSPSIVDGWVYFGSDDYNVYCVSAATGEKRWAFATEDIIEAPPLVLDGVVYIGSSDFYFYALEAETGELRWKVETDDKILGGANYVRTDDGTIIVVGSYDTNLYGFDAATGEVRWKYGTENYVNGTPAILEGKAIFGGCDAILHVVDTRTGDGLGALELGPDCHVAGSVALADGRVYFGHYGNAFVCADIAKEEVVWSYSSKNQPFFSSPAIAPDRLVFGGRDKQVHCVKRDDGTPIWTFPTKRKVDGSPVISGDKVVFGSGDGRIYILSLESGEELWSYDVGKSIISSPAVVDGTIYIGANDYRLYAFGVPKG